MHRRSFLQALGLGSLLPFGGWKKATKPPTPIVLDGKQNLVAPKITPDNAGRCFIRLAGEEIGIGCFVHTKDDGRVYLMGKELPHEIPIGIALNRAKEGEYFMIMKWAVSGINIRYTSGSVLQGK